jgi:N4-gp56 family major capsid protein
VEIMAQTIITTSAAQTKKKWAGALFNSSVPESYWGSHFMKEGSAESAPNAPIHLITDLEKDSGDEVNFDIYAQLTGSPTYGDDNLEGNEESLTPYSDKITINQVRKATDSGGEMTRKRTTNNHRMICRNKLTDWWSRFFDEAVFMNISGARGSNADYILPTSSTAAIEGQALVARSSSNIIYAGSATAKNNMIADDKFSLTSIDKAVTKAETEGGGSDGVIRVTPLRMDGVDKFVCLMHNFQEHDLRTTTSTGQWLDIQKAVATNNGTKNPIFTGSLGEYRGVVLHKHNKVTRFTDYGTFSNVAAARAIFMGRQAMVAAFGSPANGLRFDWAEEWRDYKNRLGIATKCIVGLKRPQFNGNDVNSIVIDSAAAQPY